MENDTEYYERQLGGVFSAYGATEYERLLWREGFRPLRDEQGRMLGWYYTRGNT